MSRKILLLGGSRYAVPVIESAHKLGCKVITCDYLPENIAHKYSDGYENVNIIDKEAVLNAAIKQKVDGIMSFACDPGVATAAYVAERLQLPSCGSYESVSILQNKKRFRNFLLENGFRVPQARCYADKESAIQDIGFFKNPVIVKPVDSAGSKGVSRVENAGFIEQAVNDALENSITGEIIIEDFLECKGYPSDSECFSVNGNLRFISYSAQRFDKESANPYTPAGFTWMPSITKQNKDDLASELQRLLKLLNMQTSLYNVEARECTDGNAYLMEVSPRGGGNRLAEMLRYATGTDLIMQAVRAALGESIPDTFDNSIRGNWAEIILHGRRAGKYRNLHLSKEITDNLVEKDLWVQPGEYVDDFTGANKTIGTLVMNFSSETLMNEVMEEPYRYITVEIEN